MAKCEHERTHGGSYMMCVSGIVDSRGGEKMKMRMRMRA